MGFTMTESSLSTPRAIGKDHGTVEMEMEEQPLEAMDRDETDSGAGGDVCDEHNEQAIERTASQALKLKSLEQARRKIQGTQGPVSQLKEQLENWREEGQRGSSGEALTSLEAMRKRARNFGEDILEETLKLDSLTNLLPEDRALRKEALREADGLLEGVDSVKAELAALLGRLASEAEPARAAAPAPATAPSCGSATPAPEEGPPSRPSSITPGAQALPATARAVRERDAMVPLPPASLWTQVGLPLRFEAHEGATRYVLAARAASLDRLDRETLRLRLKEGGASVLSISGICLPTAGEVAAMQHEVARALRAETPERLASLGGMASVAKALYLQLGEGRYGKFTEEVRLPEDVNVEAIQCTCESGVLEVLLPKVLLSSALQPFGQHPFGAAPAFRGHPATPAAPFRNRPAYGRSRPNGGVPFGGSMEDLFRW
jgi:hypothetical protein